MLTKKQIKDTLYVAREVRISDDGWARIQIEEGVNIPEAYPDYTEYTYDLRYRAKIISNIGQSKSHSVKGKARDSAAHQIHEELYGSVTNDLIRLRYMMETKSKPECMELLKEIIAELME